MSVEIRITGGARAGARERFEKSVVAIGRHPMNDLRFDANKDIDVSGRHAELRSVGGHHVLHDLGSTNGTFVNGERITERELSDGDMISFGADGPTATFHVVTASASAPATRVEGESAAPKATAAKAPAAKAPAPSAPAPSAPAKPKLATEVRIAHAVRQQTNTLRNMLFALAAFVVVAGGGTAWVVLRQAKESQRQVAALLAMNDSLARSLDSRLAETGVADSAMKVLRADNARIAAALRTQQQSGGDIAEYTREIRRVQDRNRDLARTDYQAIAAANKPAIVFIAVEMPDGKASSGTGFNILPGGLIVTNRHVVQDASGAQAKQIGVIFDGQKGAWRYARIEYVSATDEIALLRLITPGNYPIVSGIAGDARTVQLGAPIALLGYPLGTGTAGMDGDINDLKPVATMGIGTVSKVLDDNIQLDVFAAQGSSGSPVFDARGLVIGVLYGAAAESGGRIIYSVPSARLVKQLPADAAGVVR